MNNLSIILSFIIALGLLVFLHEFGHFMISKLFRIPVDEFGLGLPPRLVRLFKLGETEFTINLIPFGAFVRPRGEGDPAVPNGLAAANPWVRLAVLLGGPMMNLFTGFIIFLIVINRAGTPDPSTVLVYQVIPNTPAQSAGLMPNDRLLSVNEQPITSTTMLIEAVKENAGSEIILLVDRSGQTIEIRATPRINPPPDQGALGIVLTNPIRQATLSESIPLALQTVYLQSTQLIRLPGMLLSGAISPQQARPVGPVGMYTIYQSARVEDEKNESSNNPLATSNTLWLIGIISVALGVTNLLPLPALDGGRILFLLPEIAIRRRVPQQYENLVHAVGIILLLMLMFYITYQDIVNPIVIQ
jgi:regulator of sigma E protease